MTVWADVIDANLSHRFRRSEALPAENEKLLNIRSITTPIGDMQIVEDPHGALGPPRTLAAESCVVTHLSTLPGVPKKSLELHAGLGVVGQYLYRRGSEVTITDLEASMPLVRRNVQENFPQPPLPGVQSYNWMQSNKELPCPFDLVVATDVPRDIEMFVTAVKDLVASDGIAVLATSSVESATEIDRCTRISFSSTLQKVRSADENMDVWIYTLIPRRWEAKVPCKVPTEQCASTFESQTDDLIEECRAYGLSDFLLQQDERLRGHLSGVKLESGPLGEKRHFEERISQKHSTVGI